MLIFVSLNQPFVRFLETEAATLMAAFVLPCTPEYMFQIRSKSDLLQGTKTLCDKRESSDHATCGKIHFLLHYCKDYRGTVKLGMVMVADNNIDPINNSNIF